MCVIDIKHCWVNHTLQGFGRAPEGSLTWTTYKHAFSSGVFSWNSGKNVRVIFRKKDVHFGGFLWTVASPTVSSSPPPSPLPGFTTCNTFQTHKWPHSSDRLLYRMGFLFEWPISCVWLDHTGPGPLYSELQKYWNSDKCFCFGSVLWLCTPEWIVTNDEWESYSRINIRPPPPQQC
jgi:hypothetical protein